LTVSWNGRIFQACVGRRWLLVRGFASKLPDGRVSVTGVSASMS
jgi:hypothetical protein